MKKVGHCAECPFKSRTCGTRGRADAPVVIVGESPGTKEVVKGVPFIGPSGRLLSILLKEAGIPERDVYVTNAFRCLPPRSKDEQGNRVKDGLINEACRACREDLLADIAAHPRKLIIAMGSAAARTMTGKWNLSIMNTRGQIVPSELASGGILPTFHPAFILRSPVMMPQMRTDMRKAARVLSGKGFPKPRCSYVILQTEAEITAEIRYGVAEAKKLGVPFRIISDIETTGLDRHQDSFILNGFIFEHRLRANGDNEVYMVTGRRAGAYVKHLFREVHRRAPDAEWVWHNGKFDTSFLRAKGLPRSQVRVDHDTLLLSYTLDEVGGRHSLEQCIIDHLGLPSYKDETKDWIKAAKGNTFANMPRDMLRERNAKDVVYTGLLFRKLWKRVQAKEHLHKVYTELLIPASNALATVELNGMPIDQAVLADSERQLEREMEPILADMRRIVGDEDFNPNSIPQLSAALRDKFELKLLSTNKETLKEHEKNPLIAKLLEYRGKQKLLSTYIRAFKKYGARVHTSYLIHGTVTGRLSSSSPNMQNIPKEHTVRRHFKTPKGRVLVSFDYSQAELRSLAVLSGDQALINIFRSGKDLHTAVAELVYGAEFTCESEYLLDGKTENPRYTKLRRNAKTVNFGVVYGVTAPTLAARLGIPVDEAQKLINDWFKRFPRAREFMDQCRNAPMDGRPLTTVFGRERRFYVITDALRHGIENEAGNFPHQSMCSDFTLSSAVEIDKLAARGKLPGNAFQINIIHDDNMFEMDDDDEAILDLVRVVKPIMEMTPRRYGITDVTFSVDAKKGYVWSEMQKIKGLAY